jgi:hypothetical protein
MTLTGVGIATHRRRHHPPSLSVAVNRIESDLMALHCREGGGLQQMEQNTYVLGICGRIRPHTNVHLFTLQGGGAEVRGENISLCFCIHFSRLGLFQGLNQAITYMFWGYMVKEICSQDTNVQNCFYFRPFPATGFEESVGRFARCHE